MKNDSRAMAQAQAIKEGIVNLRTIIAEASCVPSSFLPTLNNKFQEIAKKCYIPEKAYYHMMSKFMQTNI